MFYNKVFYSYSAIVYLISSGIILISRYIMPILITNEYYGAIQYIPILVMSSLFQVFGNFFGGLNIAYRKTKNLMFSAIIAAIVNLGLNVVLTPKFGMYGTAVATCIGCLVMIIIRIIDADLNLHIISNKKSNKINGSYWSSSFFVLDMFLYRRNVANNSTTFNRWFI